MNASMDRVYELTRQRIAASQEEAVRALVRTNAMLEDEVEMLKAEVNRLTTLLYDRNSCDGLACEGCRWWDDEDLLDLSPLWQRRHAGALEVGCDQWRAI